MSNDFTFQLMPVNEELVQLEDGAGDRNGASPDNCISVSGSDVTAYIKKPGQGIPYCFFLNSGYGPTNIFTSGLLIPSVGTVIVPPYGLLPPTYTEVFLQWWFTTPPGVTITPIAVANVDGDGNVISVTITCDDPAIYQIQILSVMVSRET